MLFSVFHLLSYPLRFARPPVSGGQSWRERFTLFTPVFAEERGGICPNSSPFSRLYQPLYVIEFVQGLKGCEAVYVEVQELLAYVLQDGVVQLEEVQLRTRVAVLPASCRHAGTHIVVVLLGLQLGQYHLGACHYALGHALSLIHI